MQEKVFLRQCQIPLIFFTLALVFAFVQVLKLTILSRRLLPQNGRKLESVENKIPRPLSKSSYSTRVRELNVNYSYRNIYWLCSDDAIYSMLNVRLRNCFTRYIFFVVHTRQNMSDCGLD